MKVVVVRGEEALFVRHAYGDRSAWELPGGGVRRSESPEQAAAREAHEELGLRIERWTSLGVVHSGDIANADLHAFLARDDGRALSLNLAELTEARWAPLADPPQPLGRHARAVLALAAQ